MAGRKARPTAARRTREPRESRRGSGGGGGGGRRGNGRGGTGTPRRRSWAGRLLYWVLVAAVWSGIAVAGLVAWYAYDLPDVSKLGAITRQPSITFLSDNGTTFARYGDLYGEPVQVDELPKYLPEAVIATEDRRFYSHFGVDLLGLMRAAAANLWAGRIVQGGSTITQQLAKNVFLSPDRTLKRKVQEVLLALWLEANFSKQQILTLYLNRVYLGGGAYGVDAAARRYFGKPAREVNLAEAAMLAGLLKAPTRLAPINDLKAARSRAEVVLANMVDVGYIDAATAAQARRHPAGLREPPGGGRQARYFADWLLERLPDFVGASSRDLVVQTTLDLRMQGAAEQAVEQGLAGAAKEAHIGQAALVALSHDGAVRAMVGGRDYRKSQFNRVTQARRQPGSAFKPIVYLAGLEAGLRPDSVMVDKPITIDGWSPQNYEHEYAGPVTLTQALARSINTVAAQVAQYAGPKAVADAALRLGITSPVPAHPSIALGTAEVSPLELATAYIAFADGGRGALPFGITEIRDAAGHVLYRRGGSGAGQVIAPQDAVRMTAMLTETVRNGTGRAARLDRPVAGKTGTSQDYRDAWFVGYTADLVAAVWLGNDDGQPMRRVTGGGLPARLWHGFMLAAEQGMPARPLLMAGESESGESFFERLWRKLSSAEPSGPAAKGPTGTANVPPRQPAGRDEYYNDKRTP